jgi:hypothetical protein
MLVAHGRLDKPVHFVPRNLNTIACPPIRPLLHLCSARIVAVDASRTHITTFTSFLCILQCIVHRLIAGGTSARSYRLPARRRIRHPYCEIHLTHTLTASTGGLPTPPGSCGTISSTGFLPAPQHLLRRDWRSQHVLRMYVFYVGQRCDSRPKLLTGDGCFIYLLTPIQMPLDSLPSLSHGSRTSDKQITTDHQHGSLQNGSREHPGLPAAHI